MNREVQIAQCDRGRIEAGDTVFLRVDPHSGHGSLLAAPQSSQEGRLEGIALDDAEVGHFLAVRVLGPIGVVRSSRRDPPPMHPILAPEIAFPLMGLGVLQHEERRVDDPE